MGASSRRSRPAAHSAAPAKCGKEGCSGGAVRWLSNILRTAVSSATCAATQSAVAFSTARFTASRFARLLNATSRSTRAVSAPAPSSAPAIARVTVFSSSFTPARNDA